MLMIPSRSLMPLIFALVVLMAGIWQGFRLALNKPLWNDEIYSQTASVERMPWFDIWIGRIQEGNNSPLFYSVQKTLCAVSGYRSVDLWNTDEVRARFLLRIAPVCCMSLGLALIVGFFSYFYSLIGGVIAFATAISSYMVWYYWAEARPYALVFLATTLQALACLYYYQFDRARRYGGIGISNLLIAFISSLGVIQIAASVLVLWFRGCRRIGPLVWCVALPLLIAFGYYKVGPHYSFMFVPHGQPQALIEANIPQGRLGALFILPLLIWAWDRVINKDKGFALGPFFIWLWVTLFGYMFFLGVLYVYQRPLAGFEVSNRYLMALTPLGIIGVTVAMLELIKRPAVMWGKVIVWGVIVLLLLPRVLKAYHWLIRGV